MVKEYILTTYKSGPYWSSPDRRGSRRPVGGVQIPKPGLDLQNDKGH